jgi:ZIP family zinc transporter
VGIALPIGLSLLAFVSTLLGGLFALRQRGRLWLVMAFAAGVRVAAALIDLLPEGVRLAGGPAGDAVDAVFLAAAVGFLAFYGLERLVHVARGEEAGEPVFGAVAAFGMTVHSFLDGLAIGGAFRVEAALGLIVAFAVIAHDFTDGVSTVAVVLGARGGVRTSVAWLAADALAPVLGAAAGSLVPVGEGTIAALLGFFAGSFLFIGGGHLLPRSHLERAGLGPPAAVVAGFVLMFAVTRLLRG